MPEAWEDLVAAEEAYIAKRKALFSSDVDRQLRLALASPRGVGTALRVLRDAPVELTMDLLDDVFVAAVTTHPQVGLAREVLGRVDAGWLASVLRPLVAARVERSDASWEDYRRVAELLSSLMQQDLLNKVVRCASLSDDADIKEVAMDFGSDG